QPPPSPPNVRHRPTSVGSVGGSASEFPSCSSHRSWLPVPSPLAATSPATARPKHDGPSTSDRRSHATTRLILSRSNVPRSAVRHPLSLEGTASRAGYT